jgi:hypothetical protein
MIHLGEISRRVGVTAGSLDESLAGTLVAEISMLQMKD